MPTPLLLLRCANTQPRNHFLDEDVFVKTFEGFSTGVTQGFSTFIDGELKREEVLRNDVIEFLTEELKREEELKVTLILVQTLTLNLTLAHT